MSKKTKKSKGESVNKSARQWKVERFAFRKLKWFERKTKKNKKTFDNLWSSKNLFSEIGMNICIYHSTNSTNKYFFEVQ